MNQRGAAVLKVLFPSTLWTLSLRQTVEYCQPATIKLDFTGTPKY